jgi:hypothetical protein
MKFGKNNLQDYVLLAVLFLTIALITYYIMGNMIQKEEGFQGGPPGNLGDPPGSLGAPPENPSLPPTTLVPVGIKISCKLSDLAEYIPTITPDMFNNIPQGGLILVIDGVTNGPALWDPITTFRTNGTIQPFPKDTTTKSYIIYTNSIKFSPNLTASSFPLQTQADRNAIDKIIYNTLDSLVILNNISVLKNIILGTSFNISAGAIANYVDIINKFTFQSMVYEKYGDTIEHFTKENFQNIGSPSPKIYNIHSGLVLYGDNSISYETITTSVALAGLVTAVGYYFINGKNFRKL